MAKTANRASSSGKRGRKRTTRKGKKGTKRAVARRRKPTKRAPTKRRRRVVRKPKGIVANVVPMVQSGVVNAAGVLAGRIVVRQVVRRVPGLPTAMTIEGTAGNAAVQAAIAVAGGMLADRFVGPKHAEMFVAGGLSSAAESVLRRLNVPFVSNSLGEVPGYTTLFIPAEEVDTFLPAGVGAYDDNNGAVGEYDFEYDAAYDPSSDFD